MEPFYILWCPSMQFAPSERYEDENLANDAAKRLAIEHPNSYFYVCKIVMGYMLTVNEHLDY